MIVPLVAEEEWLKALEESPIWDPPDLPILLLAPHPDDETLAVGGLIASQRGRRIDVRVVAVTDGENAYKGTSGLGAVRRREQEKALERLDVPRNNIIRFEFVDGDVTSGENQLLSRLVPLVSSDTHLIAPWKHDFHPDHEVCGRVAEQLAHQTKARLTSYFFWTWHCGTKELIKDLKLVRFPLSRSDLQAKCDALLCHRSQLEHPSGEPILPLNLLQPAKRSYEVFQTS
jgi:LmbE family N-acetylglucosaminyl deacetylase